MSYISYDTTGRGIYTDVNQKEISIIHSLALTVIIALAAPRVCERFTFALGTEGFQLRL